MQDMPYASLSRRAMGALIDVFILCFFLFAVYTGTSAIIGASIELGTTLDVLLFVGVWLLWIVYYTVMETACGKSVGKYLAGVKVVAVDRTPIRWTAALTRNLVRFIDMQFCYAVGAFLYTVSRRHQRLGDSLAHTIVIRD